MQLPQNLIFFKSFEGLFEIFYGLFESFGEPFELCVCM